MEIRCRRPAKADAVGKVDPEAWNQSMPKTDPKPGPVRAKGATTPMVPSAKTPLPKVDPKPGPVAPEGANDADSSAEEHSADHRRAAQSTAQWTEAAAVESIAKVNPLPKNNPPPPTALPPRRSAGSPLPTGPKPSAVPRRRHRLAQPSRRRFPENAGAAAFASRAEKSKEK